MFALDLKDKAINLLDTMTRKPEAYHSKLLEIKTNEHGDSVHDNDQVASIHDLVVMKEEGLEQKLHYDNYRRNSLIDHFLALDTTLDNFSRSQYTELGSFINAKYRHNI